MHIILFPQVIQLGNWYHHHLISPNNPIEDHWGVTVEAPVIRVRLRFLYSATRTSVEILHPIHLSCYHSKIFADFLFSIEDWLGLKVEG